MPDPEAAPGPFRVAALATRAPTSFALSPGAEERAGIAETLGFLALRKLVFTGEIKPLGKHGWRLEGQLGATVQQSCVVTLAPVTTRIDTHVERTFRPETMMDTPDPGTEVEMPEDETVEPLGEVIDPASVMIEALSLAAPDYPRIEDAPEASAEARPDGAEPIREEDTKPFAGLADLKRKLSEGDAD
ncbi:DUF177 domain-containing protein [Roseivivax sp. THAF30]|uniref:YceD family protein n=1 Tax=Roseivivax sp. THAF30 TaxID=2587852 RepID=UPI00126825FE|nr:DUF177 domain-containing protein [Roseivivax sp. THAF30]QFT63191.1 hypothetical protein FIU91_09665 [Roseivivax sp. THAF30]